MKTSYSVVAVAAMSMALLATAAGSSQDRIPELRRDAATDSKNATLTGCVARGVASGTYTLTNFTRDAGTLTKEITPLTTVVLAGTDVDVSTHVGHRVSVTGSYASFELASYPRGELATGPALMAKPAAAAAKEDGGRKPIRTFTVKSLKMVADTCSQPAD